MTFKCCSSFAFNRRCRTRSQLPNLNTSSGNFIVTVGSQYFCYIRTVDHPFEHSLNMRFQQNLDQTRSVHLFRVITYPSAFMTIVFHELFKINHKPVHLFMLTHSKIFTRCSVICVTHLIIFTSYSVTWVTCLKTLKCWQAVQSFG